MKRLLKLLTVIMALTLSLGIFTACGETHEHDYSVLKYDGAYHWYECACGGMNGMEAHKGGTATETAKAVCEICSQEYGETVSHIHDFSAQVESELYLKSEASCESKAVYYFSCACGAKGNKTFEVGEALGHTYTEAVTAPTCETRGYTTYTCACGDNYVDNYVDALGHNYGEFVSNGDGTHTQVCANDEKHTYTANCSGGTAVCEDQAICEVCDTAYGYAPGHVYSKVVTLPTCTEEGYTTYTCSCGESYVGNIVKATGHILTAYIEPATCLAEGYVNYSCACGEEGYSEVLDILDHEYTGWQPLEDGFAYKYCVNGCYDTILAQVADGKVLYSAADKSLELTSVRNAGVDIISLDEIDGYLVNGELVDELDLEVIISNDNKTNFGRNRSVDVAQEVVLSVYGQLYYLPNVYAYTKVLDEVEDLNTFVLKGATEENPYNSVDGYYILAKNLDANNFTLDKAVWMVTTVYPGNSSKVDRGFTGVLDGNGYTIDGLTTQSCGLFTNMNAAIVKNIAFTNVNFGGGYYSTLFAKNYSRGKDINGDFNGYEGLFENVYVSINSVTFGSDKNLGILVQGTLPTAVTLNNVIVEYTNVSDAVQTQINAGKNFYMFGASTLSLADHADTYNDCYAISTAPVLQHKSFPGFAANQVEFTLDGKKVTSVGRVLDSQVTEVLTRVGKTLAKDHVMAGVKAYDNYADMAAANNDYSSFNKDLWVVKGGVPYWKSYYYNNFKLVVTNDDEVVEGDIVLSDANTELELNILDIRGVALDATITVSEGLILEDNTIKLAEKPFKNAEYEVTISAIIDGIEVVEVIPVIVIPRGVDVNAVVNYSAFDKTLDFDAINAELGTAYTAEDVISYTIGNETEEKVGDFEIPVVITGNGRERTIEPQTVRLITADDIYVLNNVYAYTRVIDEAEDLKLFTLKGATEENPYNAVDGYYILANDIDASALVLAEHTFMSGAVYPGNGYSSDNGFQGVLDGKGHIIDGLNAKSNGLFGQVIHAVIKNIAFTNATISGNYKTLFAHNINRGKSPAGSFTAVEVLIENVYISIKSVATGTARVGILANNSMYVGTNLNNVVIEYLNYEEHVQANIAAGRAFYLTGSPNKDNAATSKNSSNGQYKDVYTISKAPVLAHKLRPGIAVNQIECTYTGNNVTAVGAITDADTQAYVTKLGVAVTVDNIMHNIKAYDDYTAMAAANNDLSTFDSKYWTVSNGVVYWNGTYVDQVKAVLRDANGDIVTNAVLDSADTKLTYSFEDPTHALAGAVITAPEGVKVEGNVISLASAPAGKGEYEITISIVVEGKTLTDTITIGYTNEKLVTGTVFYSQDDKALDLTTLKNAGVEIESLDEIDGYIVNGEEVDELELEVIISNHTSANYGRNRSVDVAQQVIASIGGKNYVMPNVYAYTKVLDEAEDIKYFTMNYRNAYNEIDGYITLSKNIDASELVLDEHKFESNKNGGSTPYPGGGVSSDVGLRGVLDGNGYTIDGLNVKSCGLFACMNAAIVKNIAFTNVNLSGYYICLFANKFNRGKNYDNSFNGYEGLFENVYVSVNSINYASVNGASASNGSIGILVQGTLPSSTKLYNVIVEYLEVEETAQAKIANGNQFLMFGSSTASMASAGDTYNDCYSISPAPVLQLKKMPGFAENQIEFTSEGRIIKTVGAILDPQVSEVLARCNADQQTLSVNHVLKGLKAYDDYTAMAAANNDYTSFSTAYWTIKNGVPTWKTAA